MRAGRPSRWPRRLSAAMLLAAFATGCASTPGGKFTPFPLRHGLIEPARRIRDLTPPHFAEGRELAELEPTPYVVEPGDTILVQAHERRRGPDDPIRAPLPTDQIVQLDGSIDLGHFGRVYVAGKTLARIELEIAAMLQQRVNAVESVSVRLLDQESKFYYVLGEVNAPRSAPLIGNETVLDGLLAANGLANSADLDNIVLVRPTPTDSCRIVLPVCYRDIVQLGDTTTNYQLRPGDRIFVPTKRMDHIWHWLKRKRCDGLHGKQHHACPDCPPAAPMLETLPAAVDAEPPLSVSANAAATATPPTPVDAKPTRPLPASVTMPTSIEGAKSTSSTSPAATGRAFDAASFFPMFNGSKKSTAKPGNEEPR